MKIPEIRIKHGWLLQSAFVKYMMQVPEYKDKKVPSDEKMKDIIKNRQELWQPVGEKILTAMQEITGLNFYKNIIDVYVVFGWKSAFSDPLTMSIKYEGDDFIDTLTHEILHTLLDDNIQKAFAREWTKEQYPEVTEERATSHIVLHAIHKKIFLDIIKSPERLKKDIDESQDSPGYKLAWDIVERDGYENIINRFKASYAK